MTDEERAAERAGFIACLTGHGVSAELAERLANETEPDMEIAPGEVEAMTVRRNTDLEAWLLSLGADPAFARRMGERCPPDDEVEVGETEATLVPGLGR